MEEREKERNKLEERDMEGQGGREWGEEIERRDGERNGGGRCGEMREREVWEKMATLKIFWGQE